MNITEKDYERYKVFSRIICGGNNYYSDEVLGRLMIKFIKNEIEIPNDNYVYASIRNMYRDILDNEKYHKNKTSSSTTTYIENIEDLSESYDYKEDIEIEYKKRSIENICMNLDIFHKQLYVEHFIKGLSQREISRRTNINLSVIHNRIKIIKNKIKEEYNRLKYGKEN